MIPYNLLLSFPATERSKPEFNVTFRARDGFLVHAPHKRHVENLKTPPLFLSEIV